MSTEGISTNSTGQTEQGTSGTTIGNNSADNISTNEFLDLMLTSLQNQDPLDPSSQDPTQYLTELAQMTDVEQETNTAQSTQESATEAAVSQAISLIGDTVTYINQTTGASTTGTVNSVQITSSGPTLTVDGTAGIDPSTIDNVVPASSAGSAGSGSSDFGSSGSDSTTTGSGS